MLSRCQSSFHLCQVWTPLPVLRHSYLALFNRWTRSTMCLVSDFLKKIRFQIGKKKWAIWDARERPRTRSFPKCNAKGSIIKFLRKISGSDKRASWSYYRCTRLTYCSSTRHSRNLFREFSPRSNCKKSLKKCSQFWIQKWQTVKMMSS